MILNDILAAKIALSHEHHSFCLNDIKFRLSFIEIMSIFLHREKRTYLVNMFERFFAAIVHISAVGQRQSANGFLGIALIVRRRRSHKKVHLQPTKRIVVVLHSCQRNYRGTETVADASPPVAFCQDSSQAHSSEPSSLRSSLGTPGLPSEPYDK
jgi:hypothetical protein